MRVAVTGLGAVTGFGEGLSALVEGLLSSRTALSHHARFADVREGLSTALVPTAGSAPQYLLRALRQFQSEAQAQASSRRVATVGSTKGDFVSTLADWNAGRATDHDALSELAASFSQQTGASSARTYGAACASSSMALGRAAEMVDEGACDEALAAGVESLSDFMVSGFVALRALSATRAQPFGQGRDGLSLGEGAGVVRLESDEGARARGAPVLGWVVGFGMASDGYDQTAPHPQGDGLVRACEQALAAGHCDESDIAWYHAHGTGTALNDAAEASAVRRIFGNTRVPVTGLKGSLGHSLGAAGILDALVALTFLRRGAIPPVATTREVDASLDVDVVLGEARATSKKRVLVGTAGFGGINTALLLEAP